MKHLPFKTASLKIALLLISVTFFNCEDNTNLTNDSVGNDTFSCKINGKPYIPTAGTGIGGGDIRPFSWAYKENNRLTFYSNGEYNLFINIIIPILGSNTLNEKLNDEIDTNSNGMVLHNEIIYYFTKNNLDNFFVEVIELNENEVSGNFEGTLYNENGDELKITEGKFNLTSISKRN